MIGINQFKNHVAQNPIKFLPFIVEIVNESKIDIEYLISGLEGLQEGKCGKKDFEDLCLNIIEKRSHNFNDINLSSFLRTLHYIIRKSKFPQNPKRSVRFSGKRTKRSVQKRKARNTQKAETKVL